MLKLAGINRENYCKEKISTKSNTIEHTIKN